MIFVDLKKNILLDCFDIIFDFILLLIFFQLGVFEFFLLLNFFRFFGLFSKLLILVLNITEVTTEHQK